MINYYVFLINVSTISLNSNNSFSAFTLFALSSFNTFSNSPIFLIAIVVVLVRNDAEESPVLEDLVDTDDMTDDPPDDDGRFCPPSRSNAALKESELFVSLHVRIFVSFEIA